MFGFFKLFGIEKKPAIDIKEIDELVEGCLQADANRLMTHQIEKAVNVKSAKRKPWEDN